jgi:cell wall-associated NlpC family hydrolase
VKGDSVTCYGTSGNWTKVKKDGTTAYVCTTYLTSQKPSATEVEVTASTYTRYVTADSLTIRKSASVSSAALGSYTRGDSVTCYGSSGNWTKVKKNSITGYVSTTYLSTSKSALSGTAVANTALNYVGLRYVWGGESLTRGVDCSGFTKAIYAKYGYSLPHSAFGQRSSGKSVKSADRQPGDLICYTAKNGIYHVGIYIGNNRVVHAGSEKTGVTTATWNYRTVYCVRRIMK